jgi:hypothetical protein
LLRKIKRRIAVGALLAGILIVGMAIYGNPGVGLLARAAAGGAEPLLDHSQSAHFGG